eukprot:6631-Chlamydomonas_euryale.AAC.1
MAVPPWLLPPIPAGAQNHSRPWPTPMDCSHDEAWASDSLHCTSRWLVMCVSWMRTACSLSCRNQRSSSCSNLASPVPPRMPATL